MSSSEIIQKLARHYNKEIKYAIFGRGITRIDDLVELLENFDRIGPINISRETQKERTVQDEIKNNHQGKQTQAQPSWRSQQGGSFQDRIRRPQSVNTSPSQRNIPGGYGNRGERNTEQNGNMDWSNR